SHELKTPISIIKLNLQSLQQYELPPAETKKIISNSLNENYRIETITNNILLCNELLVDEYKVQFQEVDLNWILNKVLKKFISHPEYHTISVENIDMITILADPILIEIFLTNLIDNALKYGLKNNIEIKIKRLSHQIIFEIADQGIGIDPVNNKELFKKFSRIKNNISMKTTGTGLGLYICKLISQQHHGEFIYFPNNPTGSVFRLTLPQNK
ncbi:MAG: HAMP domain-containing sensor histidine kinase, partial [Sediminibacterium sp.]|nr:HAMP domain-containing sensor histidine kinase [Sediminibacterium sp.]